ncbi:hypothetical protein JL722_1978 [Aureococcus anophagefferens]|nr:hypothetical protein JL722_1978 [Aureococcus anophagefferens]
MLGRPRTKDDEYVCYESCKVTPRGCDSASCMADSAFVTALLAKLKGELCVDLGAVHLAGISAGGMMAYQAALDNHAQIASVAPVAGSRFVGFNVAPASPVAVLSDHFFYHEPDILRKFSRNCDGRTAKYATKYDGARELQCVRPFGKCESDIVMCVGQWGHTWPLHKEYPEAWASLALDFFAATKRSA